jgi:hypothetical protein
MMTIEQWDTWLTQHIEENPKCLCGYCAPLKGRTVKQYRAYRNSIPVYRL